MDADRPASRKHLGERQKRRPSGWRPPKARRLISRVDQFAAATIREWGPGGATRERVRDLETGTDDWERRPEPWCDVETAALYLACGQQRIYDLVAQRRLRVARDGRRLPFRREWLDEYLEITACLPSPNEHQSTDDDE